MATKVQRQELADKVGKLVADRFGGDYAKLFARYDINKDGRINKDELIVLLMDARIGNRLTRGAWASGIIAEIDVNYDDTISLDEFQSVLRR